MVDDDAAVARSLARQLADIRPAGIALEASTARELARRHAYSLALVDYHLGVEPGMGLAKSLREENDLAIVMMTADRSPAVADEVLSEGYLLIYKPMDGAQLRAMVGLACASPERVRAELTSWLLERGAPRWAAENTAHVLGYRSNADAARGLLRSEHTMRDYVRPCLEATGARNKTELLQAFLGLIDLTADD